MNYETKRGELLRQKNAIVAKLKELRAEHRAILTAIREYDAHRDPNRKCTSTGCHNLTSRKTTLATLGTYYKQCDKCRERAKYNRMKKYE
jgi:hypothetical protein